MPAGFFTQSELLSSKPPISRVPQCGSCGLFKTCKSPKMPVYGKGKRKILIVGEAPGETEDQKGRPFCGPTGQLLERTLRSVGIDMRNDCWLTNTLICRPPHNAEPSPNQIAWCRPNVIKTIEQNKPEIIVPLGGPAVESVIGWLWKDKTGGIGRWTGWHIPNQKLNAWICPAWHPSYVARSKKDSKKNPEIEVIWKNHLKSITKLEGRPWEVVPNYKSQVEIILDLKEAANRIYEMIAAGGVAAFDYETNSLKPDWKESEIVCCSICLNGTQTITFPWGGPVVEAMRVFVRSAIKKIASNLKFEDRWSRAILGTRVLNWFWDTMSAAHIIDNRRATSSIKFQSFVWLGAESYNEHIRRALEAVHNSHINRVIKDVELRQLLLYCGLDSLLEYHTCFKQREVLGYGL